MCVRFVVEWLRVSTYGVGTMRRVALLTLVSRVLRQCSARRGSIIVTLTTRNKALLTNI